MAASAKGVAEPNQLEKEVVKYLRDIEIAIRSDAIAAASDVQISSSVAGGINVSEVKLPKARKVALLIKIPFSTYQTSIRRMQNRFIIELEKKTKKHILFIPVRKIIPKNFKRKGIQYKPPSRRLTAVHDAILEDLVAPTDIVAKRIRVKTDGSQLIKVFLDPKDRHRDNIEEKLEAFTEAYKQLTHKNAIFMFK